MVELSDLEDLMKQLRSRFLDDMKNTGLEYEMLTQGIFQEILRQEDAVNVEVQRDVKITGKSGVIHQIDVFWEFEVGGIAYSTVVQVKDWRNFVKQEQILTLKSVLEDLPKQPRGVLVTKKGFQKGAKAFAENHGIELFELQEVAKPPPFQMTAGSFADLYVNLVENCFEITGYPVRYLDSTFVTNSSWVKAKRKKMGSDKISAISKTVINWQADLYNSRLRPTGRVGKFVIGLSESKWKEAKEVLREAEIYNHKFKHVFESPTYVRTNSQLIPFTKVDGIGFRIEVTKDEVVKRPFVYPDITNFILRNVIDGDERKFNVKKTDPK